jgi:hypothetical protein
MSRRKRQLTTGHHDHYEEDGATVARDDDEDEQRLAEQLELQAELDRDRAARKELRRRKARKAEKAKMMSPRSRCIARLRVNIGRRIKRALETPEELKARQKEAKGQSKKGTVDSSSDESDDEEEGALIKRKLHRPRYLESLAERELRTDLTREAIALELGPLGKLG